jgi:mannosyltransferase
MSCSVDLSTARPRPSLIKIESCRDSIALVLLAILCAALRFYHIGVASLWTDELVSRYYSQVLPLHFQFTTGLIIEPTPPTYTLMLLAWMKVFGSSESAMRSLSVLACILCIPAIYWLGRELTGKRQGLLGALLFALCPASLYYGQEARVYAFLVLSTSLALWAVAVLLRDPGSGKALAGYIVFATLCPYLHATGVLFVLACSGAVGVFWLTKGASGRGPLFRWIAANIVVLLLAAPYLFFTSRASRSGGLDWMPPFSLHDLVTCASSVVGGILTPRPWPGTVLTAGLLVILAVSLLFRPLSARANVVLVGVPLLFVVLISVISIRRPILLPRTLLWVVVPLCVAAGSALVTSGRARYAVLLGFFATFGTGLFFQLRTPGAQKEPWREITHEFAPALERADLVVVAPLSDPLVFTYYAPEIRNIRLWDAALPPTSLNTLAAQLHMETITESQIMNAIRTRHNVWVLSNTFDLSRVDRLRGQARATVFREWFCDRAPCVALAGWESH